MGLSRTKLHRVQNIVTTIKNRGEERLKVGKGASSFFENGATLKLWLFKKELAPAQRCVYNIPSHHFYINALSSNRS